MRNETQLSNLDAEGNDTRWVRKVEGDDFTFLQTGEEVAEAKDDDYRNKHYARVWHRQADESGITMSLESSVYIESEDHTYTTMTKVVLSKEEAKSLIRDLTFHL